MIELLDERRMCVSRHYHLYGEAYHMRDELLIYTAHKPQMMLAQGGAKGQHTHHQIRVK